MNIALFLGAGASVPYGMPTTEALWKKIEANKASFPRKDLLGDDKFPDIEHVLHVLDELIAFAQSRAGRLYGLHAKKTSNDYSSHMEKLVARTRGPSYDRATDDTFAQQHRTTTEKPGPSMITFDDYAASSKSAKKIIENTITGEYNWNPSRTPIAKKILRPLFELAKSKKGRVTVFTTNYDVVVERYCENSGGRAECIDGFRFDRSKRMLVWDDNFSVDDDGRRRTSVLLYKLHGSMNWLAYNADAPGTIVQKPDGSESDGRASDMYIRPSLDVKEEATQKEPYATILGRFAEALPSFDACVVIGYSFRDPHITNSLVEFATSGKLLIAVSPTAAADFSKNALREPPTDALANWKRSQSSLVKFTSGDKQGLFYPVHKKLDQDEIGRVVDEIRSIIGDASPSRPPTSAAEAPDA